MANPRQRRKARSSSHRPVSHSKNAKRNLKKTPPIRGPKALQEAWDKTKTVRQNYARLGLAISLDPLAAGGSERQLGVCLDDEGSSRATTDAVEPSLSNVVPDGFGRLIRDDSGQIVGVEIDQEDNLIEVEDVDGVDSHIDPDVRQKWVTDLSQKTSAIGVTDVTLMKELEDISSVATGTTTLALPVSGVGARHVSIGELKYLQPLLKKHGGNLNAMAGDLRLNPEQKTAGQLRRALRSAGLLMSD
ncbi:ribosome biogenesis protein Nop16 [Crepidotus variabilis]|uniref:Nucleolar protein 16 n=1 Tax=Crepidotus variabilis TaxID=179855 RepID=A0A9P6EMA5_9AGAR|nr:ribosome biogenesis protein Nop16 [Crepidotus variabilis]